MGPGSGVDSTRLKKIVQKVRDQDPGRSLRYRIMGLDLFTNIQCVDINLVLWPIMIGKL